MFRNHRVVADIPIIPGHRVEPHLIRVDHGPVRRPATSDSSDSSSSSSSEPDDDDDSGTDGLVIPDGYVGAPEHDDDHDGDSDDSVRIVYDSRVRRGEGPNAALLNLMSFLESIQGVQLPPSFDANFEVVLWTHLTSHSGQ
jgi:hypothetical protein